MARDTQHTSETLPTLDELPDPPSGKTGWPWTEASEPVRDLMPNGNPWPKISIVTPSYNQGQFIEETIRSVLLQGYPNLEYIVMDGGSDDETLEILEKYDPWIDYWESEPDDGQAHAINKGLRRATGDIHGWINSDDLLVSGALKTVALSFASTKADAITGGRLLIDEDSNVTGWGILPEFDPEKGGNTWAQESTFWRSNVYDKIGYVDESLNFAMDLDFFLRMYRKLKIEKKDILLGSFRLHKNSKTSKSLENAGMEESKKVWNNYLDEPDKRLKQKRQVKTLRKWIFWMRNPKRLAIPYTYYKISSYSRGIKNMVLNKFK
jgi:glycosyltransferase involved in cell wall biosynthesis